MKLYTPSRISRRLGERFSFKAERDSSPKATMVRRPYPPGMHGKRRRRGLSEFGIELQEKQKIRYLYGLSDGQLKRAVRTASRRRGKTKAQALVELLEERLDSVVYRLGLAPSRRIARHLVSYGHVAVNGRIAKTPSRLIRPGDSVALRESSRSSPLFEGLEIRLRKYQPPEWLTIYPEGAKGEMKRRPLESDNLISHNISKVIEYYSR